MQEFDGSEGEGGGAILRLATAFAIISKEPVRIINIRKKRPTPGLKTQHLIGLNALADFCGGQLKDAVIGSESITFIPGDNWKSELNLTISTAGSLGLVLQSIQLAALGASSHQLEVSCHGGATFGKWAPSIPYIDLVTWYIFRQLNYHIEMTVERHGFYPRGGAMIKATFHPPSSLTGIDLSHFNNPKSAVIASYASNSLRKARVADRQTSSITHVLNERGIDVSATNYYVEANNPGSGVLIYSQIGKTSLAGDFVGEKRFPAEKVGEGAVKRYINTLDAQAAVDPLLADQITPILALATSSSVFCTPYISNHLKTNISIIQRFFDVSIETYKQEHNFLVTIDI